MSVAEIFNSFPKDIQILIASNLSDQEVGKICFSMENLSICRDNDNYWRTKILSRGNDIKNIPEGMSYRDYYEYLIYDKYLKERYWDDNLLNKMLSDKVFLTRHINTRDAHGGTALVYAIMEQKDKATEILINAGADVNIENSWGQTPLIYETPIMYASSLFNKEIIKRLLKAGANINHQDNKGWTALIFASRYGQEQKVKDLLSFGADVNIKNNEGHTALSLAATNNIKRMLLDAEYKQNAQSS
jgi:hypothetical protein